MDTSVFEDQGLTDFIKAAFHGQNAYLFIGFNIVALAAYRRGHPWAFWIAAVFSAMIGGLTGLIETEARVGMTRPNVLVHAIITGIGVAGGSSLIVAYALVLTVSRLRVTKLERLLPPNNGNIPLPDDGEPAPRPPDKAPKPPPGSG